MFKNLLITYYKNKPESEIQDFIKLIYQATFGGEHLITNKEASLNYLLTECNQISVEDDLNNEPLYEIISNDYIRLNLKPYIKSNLSLNELNEVFANQKSNKSIIELENNLAVFIELVKENKINFNIKDVNNFIDTYRENNYPVFHHTEKYRKAYNPHYRVLPISFIKNK